MIGDSPNNAAKEGIDWPSLRKENPDVVGWLTVEGTSISYPVTSERGEHAGGWYLKHDFWGRASTLGCPYIDPRCTTEASHILIYGHTVDAPDSMFTPLSHAYEQQTFSLIGDAHWSTPEHGDATFKPLMAINVDALYPDIQQWSALLFALPFQRRLMLRRKQGGTYRTGSPCTQLGDLPVTP